jgi:hypothetical protein
MSYSGSCEKLLNIIGQHTPATLPALQCAVAFACQATKPFLSPFCFLLFNLMAFEYVCFHFDAFHIDRLGSCSSHGFFWTLFMT